jgi:hypothetical protein
VRSRLAVAGLLAAVFVVVLFLRLPGSDDVGRPPRSPSEPRAARLPLPPATVPAAPERNVFEYLQPTGKPEARAIVAPEIVPEMAPPQETASRAPEPVRLVGLVNRGGKLRAALSILGEVVVLGPGEEAEGYRVLSIDSDQGVRLRGPDGAERALAPGETR